MDTYTDKERENGSGIVLSVPSRLEHVGVDHI